MTVMHSGYFSCRSLSDGSTAGWSYVISEVLLVDNVTGDAAALE